MTIIDDVPAQEDLKTVNPTQPKRERSDGATVTGCIAIFALALAGAAYWEVITLKARYETTAVLVYDDDQTAQQILPYVIAGYDADEIVNKAFGLAVERGYIILRKSDEIAGGRKAIFQISDFVMLPEAAPQAVPVLESGQDPFEQSSDLAPERDPALADRISNIQKPAGKEVPSEILGLFDMLPGSADTE